MLSVHYQMNRSASKFAVLIAFYLVLTGVAPAFAATLPQATTTRYEAESGQLNGATVSTTYGGFSGDGYSEGLEEAGDSVLFTVDIAAAGNYYITVRYSTGPDEGSNNPLDPRKSIDLFINGQNVEELKLDYTGTWESWLSRSRSKPLRAGQNTIEYRIGPDDSTENIGVINLDFMWLSKDAGNGPVPQAIVESGLPFEVQKFAYFPNSANGETPRLNTMTRVGERLFVGEEADGKIFEIVDDENGVKVPQLFLDTKIAIFQNTGRHLNTSSSWHGGLRGLAFHPDFATNGKFYTSLMEDRPVDSSHHHYISDVEEPEVADSVLLEWTVDQTTGQVLTNSYREVFRVGMPVYDHAIKQINFNPLAAPGDEDYGLLYIAHGDASVQSATAGGGQNNNALGKLLRINPLQSGLDPYSVPSTNPFVGDPAYLDELYAVGFRNPHNFSFTKDETGKTYLVLTDIGRDNIEEINLVTAGGNYGWAEREGTFIHLPEGGILQGLAPLQADEANAGYIFPAMQYGHVGYPGQGFVGQGIAGGYVINNGSALDGQYIYADFAFEGKIFHTPFADLKAAITTLDPNVPSRDDPAKLTQAQVSKPLLLLDDDGDPTTPALPRVDMRDVLNDEPTYMADRNGKLRADLRFGQGAQGELYILNKRNGYIYLVTSSLPPEVPPNASPQLDLPATLENNVDDLISLQVAASDSDDDPLSYSAENLPIGLEINVTSGLITGTATVAGTYSVTLSVFDGQGGFDTEIVQWRIRGVLEVMSPSNQLDNLDESVSLPIEAYDAEGEILTFSATELPTGLSINPQSGMISGTLTEPGAFTVQITVTDEFNRVAMASFRWVVNTVPTIANPGYPFNNQGDEVRLPLDISDADGNLLTINVSGLPDGISFDAQSKQCTGIASAAGIFTVSIDVDDGRNGTAALQFTWQVNAIPTITTPTGQRNNEGETVNVLLAANDSDDEILTYEATNLPPGLVLASETGEIHGVVEGGGIYTPTITVTDPHRASASVSFTWVVNRLPVITNPGEKQNQQGDVVSLIISAQDIDNDTLLYSAVGLPGGLQIDEASGRISGTATEVGNFTVTVTATDADGGSGSAAFTWQVNLLPTINAQPTIINPGPQSSTEDEVVELALSADDADNDPLTLGTDGLPPGLTLNPMTGIISGTIGGSGTYTVVVTLMDPYGGTANAIFAWQVNARPVVENPAAQTYKAGDEISFAIQATDVDGPMLRFSATGLPAGIKIDAETGLIHGVTSETGTFIVIVTVTDSEGGERSVTFSWEIEEKADTPPIDTPIDDPDDKPVETPGGADQIPFRVYLPIQI